jgi:hypothetical protein
MERVDAVSRTQGIATQGMNRRRLLQGLLAVGGALALAPFGAIAQAQSSAGGKISARWLGGGVMELATPDYKQIAYIDAWIWNNDGWSRFNLTKPEEYATKEGFVRYVTGKKPEAVFVLLTHDYGDHMGDYFEMLQAPLGGRARHDDGTG